MAHLVDRINKKVQSERYVDIPDEADTNLETLTSIIDKPGVWKKTKTEAARLKGVISEQVGRSERREIIPRSEPQRGPTDVPFLMSKKPSVSVAEAPAISANTGIAAAAAPVNTGAVAPAANMGLEAPPATAVPAAVPNVGSNTNSSKEKIEEPPIDPLVELEKKILACNKECKALALEKKAIEEFNLRGSIEGISMPKESKLFDLLRDRILDPSPDWSTHLQTLIDISHSLEGKEYLRGGDYFEAFFQIAIVIKELPQFRDKYINFYDISNYKDLHPLPNYLYTKTVQNSGGGEHGISDITFICSDTQDPKKFEPSSSYKCGMPPIKENTLTGNPMYFISVKGYKKEKSPTKDYDIPLLNMQLSVFPDISDKQIMVCVRDKRKFLDKLGRSSDMLKHILGDKVVGFSDLIAAFTNFRIKIFSKLGPSPSKEEIGKLLGELFPENVVHKPMLSLYFHQELVVNSVMERIIEEKDRKREEPHYMCVGVLPRGGKSFIAGGIINQHKVPKAAAGYNVLFLTSAVNETRTQFKEDLISKFSDFDDFAFIDLVDADRSEEKTNNFYFMSRQLSTLPESFVAAEEGPEVSLLNDKKPGEANILDTLKRKLGGRLPYFDIVFFDEAHIGITAGSVRKNFDSIFKALPGIPIVLMTATYKRPSAVLRSNEDLFVWDLQDIKDMKSLPTLGLEEFVSIKPDILVRYPHAHTLLKKRIERGESLDNLAKPYLQFASPNFISLTFAKEEIQRMIEGGAGYNYMDFFEINHQPMDPELLKDHTRSADWMRLLRNPEHAERLLAFLTPDLEIRKDKDGNLITQILTGENRRYRALNQIFQIAQKNGSRPMRGRPFSILMFMPFRAAERDKNPIRIGELCRIWASYMMSSSYWSKNFVFLTLSAYSEHQNTRLTIEEAVAKGLVHREDYDKDLKTLIREVEREALKNDKGLVILSGDVAKMGISLPCVDVVFMMSNNPDADDIIQKMYRALTDDPPQKKDGFIVDLNLKRIVTALFDYDLQKDKLRTSSIDLPSVEDRAIRIMNLCNWGQDQMIEDKQGITFDDVMKMIKDRVVNSLRDKVISDNSIEQIEKEYTKRLFEDNDIFEKVKSILNGTTKSKRRQGKADTLLSRGTEIPGPAAVGAGGPPLHRITEEGSATGAGGNAETGAGGNAESGTQTKPVVKPAPVAVELTPAEIGKRWFEISHTFVNTLVVKSTESWSDKSMNLAALLKKYNAGKIALGDREPICECATDEDCTKIHDNLYEVIYCELKSFAYDVSGTFNPGKLKDIIEGIEVAFETPSVTWNIYIESFLNDLRAQKGGGQKRKRKTRRLNRGNGRNRKTVQQRSNRNR